MVTRPNHGATSPNVRTSRPEREPLSTGVGCWVRQQGSTQQVLCVLDSRTPAPPQLGNATASGDTQRAVSLQVLTCSALAQQQRGGPQQQLL